MKKTFAIISATFLVLLALFFAFKFNASDELSEKLANSDQKTSESSIERDTKTKIRPEKSVTTAEDEADSLSKTESQKKHPEPPAAEVDPDGNLPQGREVVAVPDNQVSDDPREQAGVIIPASPFNAMVSGMMAEMTISVGKKSGTLTPMQSGAFPTVTIVPNATAEIVLSYDDLGEGDRIHLDCPDGGKVNGEVGTTLLADANGSVKFTWQGNDNLGTHSVISMAGDSGDEKTIVFWVGPRGYANETSVPR